MTWLSQAAAQALFGRKTPTFTWVGLIGEITRSQTPIEALIERWAEVSQYIEMHSKRLDELTSQLRRSMTENRQLTPETKGLVTGDIQIVSQYLRCRLTPAEVVLSPLSLEGLFPREIDAQARYQEVIKRLFEKDFPKPLNAETTEGGMVLCKDYAEFSKKAKLLERMIRLIPATSEPATEVASSSLRGVEAGIGLMIKEALESLINAIRRILQLQVRPSDKDYVATGDRLWRISQRFDLYFEGRDKEQEALMSWYQRAAEHYAGESYFHEKRLEETGLWRMDVVGKLSPKGMIDSVAEKLGEDLERIMAWSGSEARAELMAVFLQLQREQQTTSPTMTAAMGCAYVSIYQKMEGRAQKWSQDAWKIRKLYEKELRGHKDYLNLVKMLDKKLADLETGKLSREKAAWRNEIAVLFGAAFFSRANDCFAELGSSGVEQLRHANWVHHTAYAAGETEGYLAFEMNAWMNVNRDAAGNGVFDAYRLDCTRSLCDDVVEGLHDSWKKIKGPASLALHPDKGESEAERAVREVCYKQLQVWLSHAATMRETWASGQWIAAAPSDALQITDADGAAAAAIPPDASTAEKGFQVSEPQEPLDLSVLSLKKEYLEKLKRNFSDGIDARKRTSDETPAWRRLHTGNAEDREFYEQSTQYETFLRQRAAEQKRLLAELKVMLDEARQRLKKAIREREEGTRELEEAIREREEGTRELEEAIREREEGTRELEEAIREREEATHMHKQTLYRVLPIFLSTAFSASRFQDILPRDRKALYDEQRQKICAQMFSHYSCVFSLGEIEKEVLRHLRGDEYSHIRDLVPPEVGSAAAAGGIASRQGRYTMYSPRDSESDSLHEPLLGQRQRQ